MAELRDSYHFDYYVVYKQSFAARDLLYEGKEIILENENYYIFKD